MNINNMTSQQLQAIADRLDDCTRDSFVRVQEKFKEVPKRDHSPGILFMGTGQGTHNIASRGRSRIGVSRLVSGPIVSSSSSSVWIDPGPDCLEAIGSVLFDPRHVDALLLGHAHVDHMSNLLAAVELITGATEIKKTKSVYGNTTSILGSPDSPSVIGRYHAERILQEVTACVPGDSKVVGDLRVEVIPCHHRETALADAAINWRIRVPLAVDGGFIDVCVIDGNIFVPDEAGEPTLSLFEDVIKGCEGADVLVVNVANHVRMRTSRQNYPSTRGLVALAERVRPRLVLTTHFGIEMMNPSGDEVALLTSCGCKDAIEFQAAFAQAELERMSCNCVVMASFDGLRVGFQSDRTFTFRTELGPSDA